MLKRALLSLLILTALSGCRAGARITIPGADVCTVAGFINDGAWCVNTLSSKITDLTRDQYFDMLEPKLAVPDPDHPGEVIPGRAGAVSQSAHDWNEQKIALESACRLLGKNCTVELRQALDAMQMMTNFQEGVPLK